MLGSEKDDTSYSEKVFRVLPTGVEPMTFRTMVGRSSTELQETRRSLGNILGSNVQNFPHTAS